MPQISLYVDDATLKKITGRAKIEGKSVSKWVKSRINDSLDKEWPEDYFSLFGSIKDETFFRPQQANFENDSSREEL